MKYWENFIFTVIGYLLMMITSIQVDNIYLGSMLLLFGTVFMIKEALFSSEFKEWITQDSGKEKLE